MTPAQETITRRIAGRLGVDPDTYVAEVREAMQPSGLTLRDVTVPITYELATEPAAVVAIIEHAQQHPGEDTEAAGLAALPPERAAQKRQAIAQRRARGGR